MPPSLPHSPLHTLQCCSCARVYIDHYTLLPNPIPPHCSVVAVLEYSVNQTSSIYGDTDSIVDYIVSLVEENKNVLGDIYIMKSVRYSKYKLCILEGLPPSH